jgi:molybdate transport system substrate-binding protein
MIFKKIVTTVTLITCLACSACQPTAGSNSLPAAANAKNGNPATSAQTLTVLAAASLTESFGELGKLFESQNKGVTLSFSFAGSQALAEQLVQGARADVFASASSKTMTSAVDAKRVIAEDVKTFALNKLVVILPRDNPGNITTLKDLGKAGLKLDLADKSVPVGQYALDFLTKASADDGFGADFKEKVLKNVVSYEENVKAVVTKVSLGEADAGIVYFTDITASAAEKTKSITIPDGLNVIAKYPIAVVSDSQNMPLARAFVDLLLSAEGQAVLAKYGFLPPAAK